MKIQYKRVKKVKMIRKFIKKESVFAGWKEDTLKSRAKAFNIDAKFIKTDKFIKDKDDLEATHAVLSKYFTELNNSFLN